MRATKQWSLIGAKFSQQWSPATRLQGHSKYSGGFDHPGINGTTQAPIGGAGRLRYSLTLAGNRRAVTGGGPKVMSGAIGLI